jgi:hypothetical protein
MEPDVEYVVNLRFEVGVENSTTETEHVLVCLCQTTRDCPLVGLM